LESILDLLDLEGFEAIGAENGQIGVRLAEESPPELIICDILMPQFDGHEVLSSLRNNPSTALIPFIFLTAKGTVDDFRAGMNLGADDYLTKPFKQADLLQAITTRLDKQAAVTRLKESIEQLEQTKLLQDQFLTTASDELREPITNIKLAIQMIREAQTKEKQQRYIELLQSECTREINLINDLLDLQKLATNSRPLRLEPLKLQNWIPTIAKSYEQQARARQQSIQVIIPPYLPKLMLDSLDLQRIVGELLNNACKYTAPQGKIVLEIYRAPLPPTSEQTSPLLTTVAVSNEAEIPAEALSKLFDQFYRVSGGDQWRQGGSGLGLTLIKKLVERLNGTVQVVGEEGWTHFYVHLPAEIAA
jgi:signal transduction histidine kinase